MSPKLFNIKRGSESNSRLNPQKGLQTTGGEEPQQPKSDRHPTMFQRRKHTYKKSMDIREQGALKLPNIGAKVAVTDQSFVSVQSVNTSVIQNQNED